MLGWLTVLVLTLAQATLAVALLRRAARRRWDYLAVAAGTVLLIRPLYALVTGDISRIVPGVLFSDGADGKDQIILASVAATLLLPLLSASALLWLWHKVRDG